MPARLPFESILSRLPVLSDDVATLREALVAELAMVSQIPAPTFGERDRAQFIEERFGQFGLSDVSLDELSNVVAVHPGADSSRSILLVAHLDTLVAQGVEHATVVQSDRVVGPSVADDSLGLAVLATLPHVMETIGVELGSDLILLATTRSIGRGNLEGLRFFLENTPIPIGTAVCVEGAPLGRLSHSSIGMIRGEIVCRIPDEHDWTRFGSASAIVTVNEIINRMLEIPLPRRPQSTIVLGQIHGGASAQTVARQATLRFEARSESGQVVGRILSRVGRIAHQVAAQTGEDVSLEIIARRHPGGLDCAHPLTERALRIIGRLGVQPRMTPSTSELAALISRRIPAVTIGMTERTHASEDNEAVLIQPMAVGLAQLIGLLLAIDGGYCAD